MDMFLRGCAVFFLALLPGIAISAPRVPVLPSGYETWKTHTTSCAIRAGVVHEIVLYEGPEERGLTTALALHRSKGGEPFFVQEFVFRKTRFGSGRVEAITRKVLARGSWRMFPGVILSPEEKDRYDALLSESYLEAGYTKESVRRCLRMRNQPGGEV